MSYPDVLFVITHSLQPSFQTFMRHPTVFFCSFSRPLCTNSKRVRHPFLPWTHCNSCIILHDLAALYINPSGRLLTCSGGTAIVRVGRVTTVIIHSHNKLTRGNDIGKTEKCYCTIRPLFYFFSMSP